MLRAIEMDQYGNENWMVTLVHKFALGREDWKSVIIDIAARDMYRISATSAGYLGSKAYR